MIALTTWPPMKPRISDGKIPASRYDAPLVADEQALESISARIDAGEDVEWIAINPRLLGVKLRQPGAAARVDVFGLLGVKLRQPGAAARVDVFGLLGAKLRQPGAAARVDVFGLLGAKLRQPGAAARVDVFGLLGVKLRQPGAAARVDGPNGRLFHH